MSLLVVACVAPGAATPTGVPRASVSPQPTRIADSGEGSPEVLDLSPWPADEFWLQVAPGGFAIYVYGSLEAMTTGVDLIVVGRAKKILEGPPLPPDAGEGSGVGRIEFAIEEVISGRPVEARPGVVLVQFVMTDARLFPRFAGRVPDERVVLFLANMGEHAKRHGFDPTDPTLAPNVYSIQGPQGFLRDVDGAVAVPPGDEEVSPWLQELEDRPFDDVVRDVRAIASEA